MKIETWEQFFAVSRLPAWARVFFRQKFWLVLGNVGLGGLLVVLSFRSLLPLDPVHFLFFSFLLFLVALYRPGITFLFLIGLLPYETVHIAPAFLPFDLRPYQLVALLLFLALIVRTLSKKQSFAFFRIGYPDFLLAFVALGAFLSVFGAQAPSIAGKQALVVLSFGLVYFVMRQFMRTEESLAYVEPFLAGGAAVVFSTAIWQAFRIQLDLPAFTAMVKRPNATFAEADWLGFYAAFIILFLSARLAARLPDARGAKLLSRRFLSFCGGFALQAAGFATLILSVSRSAWLAALTGFLAFFALLAWEAWHGYVGKRTALFSVLVPSGALVAGLLFVQVFSLSDFDLSTRAGSTASGFQTITVACERQQELPERIGSVEELAPLGCRHIDLEAIAEERAQGRYVTEILRPDPNVSIRRSIYEKSFGLIVAHPVLGIGWGNAPLYLGEDSEGHGLNASNMFLEVWLGSGFVGFFGFLVAWFWILLHEGSAFVGRKPGAQTARLTLSLFVLVSVFNLFNSGLLLSLMAFFLALGFYRSGRPLFRSKTA
jgi:hypothetical protein